MRDSVHHGPVQRRPVRPRLSARHDLDEDQGPAGIAPQIHQALLTGCRALQGIKEVKVAFDITAGDAKALLARLNVIDETRQSLIKQILSRPARQS